METRTHFKSERIGLRLMVPGPVDVDDAVLAQMGAPVMSDCDPGFIDLYKNVLDRLKGVFCTSGDIILLVSSASGGLEAAINSLLPPGTRAIVLTNGFFGERLATMVRCHDIDVIEVSAPWGQPIDVKDVRLALEHGHGVTAVIGVHHETSTGVLNPIADLGSLCRDFDVLFIVDAISSLGCEEFHMDDWFVDVCVTTCNKCLEAAPGLAPVAVGSRAWDRMKQRESNPLAGI